jgi:hypothetical protein
MNAMRIHSNNKQRFRNEGGRIRFKKQALDSDILLLNGNCKIAKIIYEKNGIRIYGR